MLQSSPDCRTGEAALTIVIEQYTVVAELSRDQSRTAPVVKLLADEWAARHLTPH